MIVIPAIDLKDGQAVRLYKGDYQQKTVYSSHPEDLALEFEKMGAQYLHVVDLDGAKQGQTGNLTTIKKIRETISIPIEVGGGIRDMETVELYLDRIGIDRVILGTAAIENPEFLKMLLNVMVKSVLLSVWISKMVMSLRGAGWSILRPIIWTLLRN